MNTKLLLAFKQLVHEATHFEVKEYGGYDVYSMGADGKYDWAMIRYDGGGNDRNQAFLTVERHGELPETDTLTLHQFEHLSSYTAHSCQTKQLVVSA